MLDELIIARTLRVPAVDGPAGDGAAVARQMDAVLATVGFKATRELIEHIAGLEPGVAMDRAVLVIGAVRELVGDHVQHNPYFVRFPRDVPDTAEFWLRCVRQSLIRSIARAGDPLGWRDEPTVESLQAQGLPGVWAAVVLEPHVYGRRGHTWQDLLEAHEEFVASAGDRLTVLHLGADGDAEAAGLYRTLAASTTPLAEADRAVLELLSAVCVHAEQPESIPVRETRAVVNACRLAAGADLIGVDTVTDVLRLACQVSDGDVTLAQPTRFRSFRRAERRALMAALERVVADEPGRLADVARHRWAWQRLGKHIQPEEGTRDGGPGSYAAYPHAREVFAVARGHKTVRSLAGRIETALRDGDTAAAVTLASTAPGVLVRRLDHLLRQRPGQVDRVLAALASTADRVSGRVLCSLREHLDNRTRPDGPRVFVNRRRRAWTTDDTRPPLPPETVSQVLALLDDSLLRRLPRHERLVVDPAVLDVAVPLSGSAGEDGFAVMPRGSVAPVRGEVLSMFTYWREKENRTDFDLSLLMLDEDFGFVDQVSWTNYHSTHLRGVVHSGDLTNGRHGATEFIDVPLTPGRGIGQRVRYLVPQVLVYGSDSENFEQVAESMFGWMTRSYAQKGLPYQATTVRTRSVMRGQGRIALPVAFTHGEHDEWTAKWLHLYLPGREGVNVLEGAHTRVSQVAKSILGRRYLTVGRMVELLAAKAGSFAHWEPGAEYDGPVTFIGIERPEDLPEESEVITLADLNRLVPE